MGTSTVATPFEREEAEMGEKVDKAKGKAKTVASGACYARAAGCASPSTL